MIVVYLYSLVTLMDKIHSLQSFVVVQFVIPKARAGLGKMVFWFSAHFTWNSPQIVQNVFTLGDYKSFYYLYVYCERWEFDRFLFVCFFGHLKLYVVPALGKVTLEKEISDLSGALSHPWF